MSHYLKLIAHLLIRAICGAALLGTAAYAAFDSSAIAGWSGVGVGSLMGAVFGYSAFKKHIDNAENQDATNS